MEFEHFFTLVIRGLLILADKVGESHVGRGNGSAHDGELLDDLCHGGDEFAQISTECRDAKNCLDHFVLAIFVADGVNFLLAHAIGARGIVSVSTNDDHGSVGCACLNALEPETDLGLFFFVAHVPQNQKDGVVREEKLMSRVVNFLTAKVPSRQRNRSLLHGVVEVRSRILRCQWIWRVRSCVMRVVVVIRLRVMRA